MVGKVIDPFAEDRDLDVGRSGVLVVEAVGLDDPRLDACCQSMYLLICLPGCRWLVGHSRVTGEYTRRRPIDNLQSGWDDLEHRRRRAGELPIRLQLDRLLALDLDAASLSELDLTQPAVRAPIEHRQAANPQPASDVADRHHVEPAV